MQTILGIPYTPPTPDELQALIRQAHQERAQAIRDAWSSLFEWRHATKAEVPASLRPSL
jgi:hypothetical protein